ncbi:hypothetical protein PBI_KATHERINEG_41 [Gordonia phage KatherineG]|uniref:Uncharacterized protein n=1 Tax=Gordonia phage KatherineG TaxID=1838070 RepID=A0A160DIX6_9CAUD|nr:hypothetical protein BEN62_gp069 [Gordonia phage KatherineG]ANA87174.1 hypothetical protein PBI_KATHERINEG_41 [Gordonia phage KatherineG]
MNPVLYFNGERLGYLAARPEVNYEYEQIGSILHPRIQKEGELTLRFFELPEAPKPRKRVNRVTGLRRPS